MSEVELEETETKKVKSTTTKNEIPSDATDSHLTNKKETPKACLLYDGNEDSAYMCVRMARDKEFDIAVCSPKFKEGKDNTVWNKVKEVISRENNQIKFHELSASSTDLEQCCIETAKHMLKEKITFLFVGFSNDRIQGTERTERKLINSLPTTLENLDKDLRVVFPNQSHSTEFIQSNRQNLNLKEIYEPKTK